ncbi:OsmC-like protein [Fimicolochytrium jonesii]|uniref:OsmC-like protein n=1 Tax=Fimicolochytrium jonesii TaxID=1396493 RepID=UPI0022FE995D|nr:OsmC-like protein [Fimicolochytrium jonesii]KAI8820680.1 OsmC-like protein [Fimicolochytrium jonesii]
MSAITLTRTIGLAARHRVGLSAIPAARRISTASLGNSIYQTTSSASGKGRQGKVQNHDSGFSSQLALPKSMGGPGNTKESVNPEILFASGYASCFLGAVHAVAGAKKIKLPQDTSVDVTVDLLKGDNFDLKVKIVLKTPGLDKKAAQEVVDAAHQTCPYSRATRNNCPQEVSVVV